MQIQKQIIWLLISALLVVTSSSAMAMVSAMPDYSAEPMIMHDSDSHCHSDSQVNDEATICAHDHCSMCAIGLVCYQPSLLSTAEPQQLVVFVPGLVYQQPSELYRPPRS